MGVGRVSQTGNGYGELVPPVEVAAFIWKMETGEAKKIYKQREAVAKSPNVGIKNKISERLSIVEETREKHCSFKS